jgi:hypothetical protein
VVLADPTMVVKHSCAGVFQDGALLGGLIRKRVAQNHTARNAR